jgi:hypothetical protein
VLPCAAKNHPRSVTSPVLNSTSSGFMFLQFDAKNSRGGVQLGSSAAGCLSRMWPELLMP